MSAVPIQPRPELTQPVPPLENGDRLSRAEFERRYLASPHIKKAELIEGVVYMPSPVRIKRHAKPHVLLSGWLCHYIASTPGLELFGDNGTVRLDEDNEPQPDLFIALGKAAGGKATLSEDDYLEGAPDLVCELAASSVSIDMHHKLNAYRRNGVREYLVWRTIDRAVDWFVLRESKYERILAKDGVLASTVFPGLWLDVPALLNADLPALFATVTRGTQGPEHSAFLKRLTV
jgi:Uma2 family endonuclease